MRQVFFAKNVENLLVYNYNVHLTIKLVYLYVIPYYITILCSIHVFVSNNYINSILILVSHEDHWFLLIFMTDIKSVRSISYDFCVQRVMFFNQRWTSNFFTFTSYLTRIVNFLSDSMTRDVFNSTIIHFSHLGGYISTASAYGVYISQLEFAVCIHTF